MNEKKMELEVTERGFTDKNVKKLFKWEGWKKEIIWIVLLLVLIAMAWSYKHDMDVCKEIIANPCVQDCFRNPYYVDPEFVVDLSNFTYNVSFETTPG